MSRSCKQSWPSDLQERQCTKMKSFVRHLDNIHSVQPQAHTNDWLRNTDLMPSRVEGKLSHIIHIIIHISTSGGTPSGWRQVVTLTGAAIQGSYAESFGAFVAATEGSHLEAMIWMHLTWWVWEVWEGCENCDYIRQCTNCLVHLQQYKQPWTQLGPWSKAGHPNRPLILRMLYNFDQFLCK